jgi:hypothetical protein
MVRTLEVMSGKYQVVLIYVSGSYAQRQIANLFNY